MPAKSKHMEQRKQRIANAKKNARLAGRLRRRRRLQALSGLIVIAAVLTLAYLWQTGFFASEEPPPEDPAGEITESLPVEESPTEGTEESPVEEPSDEAVSETESE
ncbi:hypothetical protein AB0B28_00795 [Glycomyces sp. NPDC046736]|uniref:hypothetical protein n=1 Tax=Glycomyces sp. NPDC046736 TaxID=3155615 RepID=UPI0033CC80C9